MYIFFFSITELHSVTAQDQKDFEIFDCFFGFGACASKCEWNGCSETVGCVKFSTCRCRGCNRAI